MTAAVQSRNGVTHAIVLSQNHWLAGCTACGVRFWVEQRGKPSWFVIKRDERMTNVEANIDCMSCLVHLPAYDEACTDGSPPTSETA